MCPKEQLGIVELVEIVGRISRSEFDSLDFLQINIENSLLMRGLAAEFQALKRIFTAASSDPLNIDGDDDWSTVK